MIILIQKKSRSTLLRLFFKKLKDSTLQEKFFCYNQSIKQRVIPGSSMAEHSAVNRRVVGSSPTRGVLKKKRSVVNRFFLWEICKIIILLGTA